MIIETLVFVVVPLFALIAIGYAVAVSKLLGADVGHALGAFVTTIAVPALLFRTLATADLAGVSPWWLWATYYPVLFSVGIGAALLVRKVFRREARAAVVAAISSGFSNTALLGIPLITAVYGDEALVPLSIVIAAHIPSVTIVSVIAMERAVVIDGYTQARPMGEVMQAVVQKLLGNPIVLAIGSGVLWNVFGLPWPELLERTLQPVAKSASTVALISVGMSMLHYGIRGTLSIGVTLSVIKILVFPALVLLWGIYVTHLPGEWLSVLVLAAACPTGVMAYVFANQFGTGHAMSTNSISITTMASIVTASGWIWLLHALGY
ncbi:AEC family transporter [Polycladidibacter hongkongensis]|uniref:AEC family transporter n=1 Tax=Polycladidibacter hongkongensis TaxID=1647556 RepID=UPI0008360F26|nr:AEC family transporter [Pseudovibrio hongkongensis]